MAKIKFTAMMADARNKLNGSVFSKNRYGAYIRTKVTPVNPQTEFQQAQRQALASLSSNWRGLTESERKTWRSAVNDFLVTDIFGDQMRLAANALFVRLNKNLLNAGQSPIDTAPLPQSFPEYLTDGLTATEATPALDLSIQGSAAGSNYLAMIYATGNVSPGRQFVKNLYRFIGTETASASTIDILAAWQARFGTPIAGMRVSVRMALVNIQTGQLGVPSQATAIWS